MDKQILFEKLTINVRDTGHLQIFYDKPTKQEETFKPQVLNLSQVDNYFVKIPDWKCGIIYWKHGEIEYIPISELTNVEKWLVDNNYLSKLKIIDKLEFKIEDRIQEKVIKSNNAPIPIQREQTLIVIYPYNGSSSVVRKLNKYEINALDLEILCNFKEHKREVDLEKFSKISKFYKYIVGFTYNIEQLIPLCKQIIYKPIDLNKSSAGIANIAGQLSIFRNAFVNIELNYLLDDIEKLQIINKKIVAEFKSWDKANTDEIADLI